MDFLDENTRRYWEQFGDKKVKPGANLLLRRYDDLRLDGEADFEASELETDALNHPVVIVSSEEGRKYKDWKKEVRGLPGMLIYAIIS